MTFGSINDQPKIKRFHLFETTVAFTTLFASAALLFFFWINASKAPLENKPVSLSEQNSPETIQDIIVPSQGQVPQPAEKFAQALDQQIEDDLPPNPSLDHAWELLGKGVGHRYLKHRIASAKIKLFVFRMTKKALPKEWKVNSSKIAKTILEESEKYGFDPLFLLSVIQGESSFRPDIRGPIGEIGLMQIRPTTGAWIAKRFDLPWKGEKSLFDPIANIRLGAAYFHHLRKLFGSHSQLYVAAYNMGLGNVRAAVKKDVWPKEYPKHVMKHYLKFVASLSHPSS